MQFRSSTNPGILDGKDVIYVHIPYSLKHLLQISGTDYNEVSIFCGQIWEHDSSSQSRNEPK